MAGEIGVFDLHQMSAGLHWQALFANQKPGLPTRMLGDSLRPFREI
jgi:hypothetical protein